MRFILVVILGALSLSCVQVRPNLEAAVADLTGDEETAWVCPMHAHVTSESAGGCPVCGMALVLGTPFDMRDYVLQVETVPQLPIAGEKVTLKFRVIKPGDSEVVTDFEFVHEMPYHLFVVSQDLEFFRHIHPEQGDDGDFSIDIVLPEAGNYLLVSDFAPKGSSSQMVAQPLITAGASENLLAGTAQLKPETQRTSTVGSLKATVSFDPPSLVAGQHGHLTFHLTEAGGEEPIRDLEPYLGAFGHMFVMDEQAVDFVHAHPVETPSSQLNIAEVAGGPDVIFEGLMPKPGWYRAWAQFKRKGEVHTFVTTFRVLDVGEQVSSR